MLILVLHAQAKGAAHRSHGGQVAVVEVKLVSAAGFSCGAGVGITHPGQLGAGHAYLHRVFDCLSRRRAEILGVLIVVEGLGALAVVEAYVFILPAGGLGRAVIEARIPDYVAVHGGYALGQHQLPPLGEDGVGVAAGRCRGVASSYYVYVSFEHAVLNGSGISKVGVPAEVLAQGLKGRSGGYYLDIGGRYHKDVALVVQEDLAVRTHGVSAPHSALEGLLRVCAARESQERQQQINADSFHLTTNLSIFGRIKNKRWRRRY